MTDIEPTRAAITSIVSAAAGTWYSYTGYYLANFTLSAANTAFQHAAWTIAILAGLVSIINGVRQWKIKRKNVKNENRIF